MSDRGAHAAGAHCLDLSALHGPGSTGSTGATGSGASAGADETHGGAEAWNQQWAIDKIYSLHIVSLILNDVNIISVDYT